MVIHVPLYTGLPISLYVFLLMNGFYVLCGEKPYFLDINCDFEEDFCDWKYSSHWKRENGSLVNLLEGPGFDHTFGNETGHYIYLHSPLHDLEKHSIVLQSPFLPATNASCFSFAFHIFGIHMKSLSVYLSQINGTVEKWTRKGSQDNLWHEANITINNQAQFEIIIAVAVAYPDHTWTVAIDDIRYIDGECKPPPHWCDFEMGFCNWKFESEFEWYLSNADDYFSDHERPTDHTMGTFNGQFAHSRPFLLGIRKEIKTLISEVFPPTNNSCLQLWYLISDGSDSLIISQRFTEEYEKQLVILNDVTKHYWISVEIPITSEVDYEIILKSELYHPFVAIDDVVLHERTCESFDMCSFQYGFCNWQKNLTAGKYEWLRTTGGTANTFPSPEVDATGTDSGYFIFMPVIDEIPKNSIAALYSLNIDITPIMCFSLKYNMIGSLPTVGEIHIVIYDSGSGQISLFVNKTTENSQWRYLSIPLSCRNVQDGKIMITVEAITGTGKGYIAIDDLQISQQECLRYGDLFDGVRGIGQPICRIRLLPSETSTSKVPSTETSPHVITTLTTLSTPESSKNSTNSYMTQEESTFSTAEYNGTSVTTGETAHTANLTFGTTQQDNKTHIITVVTENVILTEPTTVESSSTFLIGCPDSCNSHGLCDISSGVPVCRCLANFTGPMCEESLFEKQPTEASERSFFENKDAFIWITIPGMTILLTVISIMGVSLYRYRKRSWHKEVGLSGSRNSRRTLLYNRNSMTEGDVVEATNSCEEASQYHNIFHPGGSYSITDGIFTALEGAYSNAKEKTFMSSSDA